jgi:hypothetical protein
VSRGRVSTSLAGNAKQLTRLLRRVGFEPYHAGNTHLCWRNDSGQVIVGSCTPRDGWDQVSKRVRAQLRALGIDWP